MRHAWILFGFSLLCGVALAQVGEGQPKSLLESDDFNRMKANYRACVMTKGSGLMAVTDFETAVEYAALACRRSLLQIKRYMLGSAFKVEVVDDLLASVAEGVKIDLVNLLLDEMLDKEPSAGSREDK
jgi:hypothetical protein